MFKNLVKTLFVLGIFIGNSTGQVNQSEYFLKPDLKIKPIVSKKFKFFGKRAFVMGVYLPSPTPRYVNFFYNVANDEELSEVCDESIAVEFKKKWFADNPSPLIIEVIRRPQELDLMGPAFYSYGWILNGDKNFAVDLVRQGGCEAKAMLVKKDEETQIFVKEEFYEKFKKQVFEAESLAKKEKIGIWKNQPK